MFCPDIQSTEGHTFQQVLQGLGLHLTLNSNIEENNIKENQQITFFYCTCLLLDTLYNERRFIWFSEQNKLSSAIFYHFNKQYNIERLKKNKVS